MKTAEMMAELADLHPHAYQLEGLEAWAKVADKLLREFEGAPLRSAFDEVTKGWKQGYAPKPADFVEAAKRARAKIRAPRELPEVRDTASTRRPEFALAAAYVAAWEHQDLEQGRRMVFNWLLSCRDDLDMLLDMLEQHGMAVAPEREEKRRRAGYKIQDLATWITTRIGLRVDGGLSMGNVGMFVRQNRSRLVDDWLRDEATRAENFLGQFSDEAPAPEKVRFGQWRATAASPNDRQRAHRRLMALLHNRAHRCRHAAGPGQAGPGPGQRERAGSNCCPGRGLAFQVCERACQASARCHLARWASPRGLRDGTARQGNSALGNG